MLDNLLVTAILLIFILFSNVHLPGLLYARIWVDDLVGRGDLKFKCDDSDGDT